MSSGGRLPPHGALKTGERCHAPSTSAQACAQPSTMRSREKRAAIAQSKQARGARSKLQRPFFVLRNPTERVAQDSAASFESRRASRPGRSKKSSLTGLAVDATIPNVHDGLIPFIAIAQGKEDEEAACYRSLCNHRSVCRRWISLFPRERRGAGRQPGICKGKTGRNGCRRSRHHDVERWAEYAQYSERG